MNILSLFAQTSNDMYAIDMSNSATDGIILGIIVFIITIGLIAYIIISYLLSRIFKKAGVAGWKAWVPVYNTWVTLQLGGQKGWIALLLLAPLVVDIISLAPGAETATLYLMIIAVLISLTATVFLYIAMYKIGLHFGKEDYFVLWAIFLPIVWYAWLAFDQSVWKKSVVTAKFDSSPSINKNAQPPATDL